MSIAEFVFWGSAGLLVYAQVGYPLLLALLVAAGGRPPRTPEDAGRGDGEPFVSLVVAAHREDAVIADKVANARALDWPADRLEVIVACDGSPDDTARRAREAGADLVLELPWGGKVRAQDRAVAAADPRSTVIAFSDANSSWDAGRAARAGRAGCARIDVGYVCGQVRFVNPGDGSNQEGLYWRYEMWLRERESDLASVTAGNGAIYAVRRDDYIVVDPVMGHDLSFPFNFVKRDRRALYAAGSARDGEDGADDRGRVRPQAANDEPRVADRPARRDALAARLPAALRADDRLAPPAALRGAVPAPGRAGGQCRIARRGHPVRGHVRSPGGSADRGRRWAPGGACARCSLPATTC